MPADQVDIHSSESSPEPSTPSTSLLDSRSHIVRASARNAKHERAEGSLGLIDAARVRLSKDVSGSARCTPDSHNQPRICRTRVAPASSLNSYQFRAFICSTSKLQRVHSISSEQVSLDVPNNAAFFDKRAHTGLFCVQTEEAEDQRFVYPEYANCPHPHPVDLDIEPMELGTEERHGRGLGTRVCHVLNIVYLD